MLKHFIISVLGITVLSLGILSCQHDLIIVDQPYNDGTDSTGMSEVVHSVVAMMPKVMNTAWGLLITVERLPQDKCGLTIHPIANYTARYSKTGKTKCRHRLALPWLLTRSASSKNGLNKVRKIWIASQMPPAVKLQTLNFLPLSSLWLPIAVRVVTIVPALVEIYFWEILLVILPCQR